MLPAGLADPIAAALAEHVGEPVAIRRAAAVAGGCINSGWRLETSAGPFFLKTNPGAYPAMFAREAEGLAAMAAIGTIAVPIPIAHGEPGGGVAGWLLTTWVEPGRAAAGFQATIGAQLAAMHRAGRGERFGFPHDNYIGSTPQKNGWMEDWPAFFRERRLRPQFAMATRGGHGGELARAGDRLMARIDDLLATAEPPTLIHGDLWGGNYLCRHDGAPVLIDPAAYHGHREAELAMTTLFGGFDASFRAAYEEVWPLEPGWRDREPIYQLYHLLNHLNLFGGSYLGSVQRTLERCLR